MEWEYKINGYYVSAIIHSSGRFRNSDANATEIRSTDIIDYFDIDDIAVNYRDCLIPLRMTTKKELLPAHNIRKMFIAGAFTDEITLHEVWRKLYDTAKEEDV